MHWFGGMIGEAVNRLRRAAAAMRDGKPVPPVDAVSLANAIDSALAGTTNLDVALGLIVSSPVSRQALARRAQLILQLSRNYNGSLSGRAKQMATDAEDYAATIWPEVRGMPALLSGHAKTSEVILSVLQSEAESGGARWPLAWRSIVKVLEPLQPIRWDCKLIASQNRRP